MVASDPGNKIKRALLKWESHPPPPKYPMNLRGLVGIGGRGGKAVKLLSPPLLSRAHWPSFPGPKWSSRQFPNELILEEGVILLP